MEIPNALLRKSPTIQLTNSAIRAAATFILRRISGVSAARTAFAISLVLVTGCASAPPPTDAQDQLTVAEAKGASTHARDLRGDYRQALCARLPADRVCDDILLRLPGEPAARRNAKASAALAIHYRIAFVSGLFADCTEKWATPFEDAVAELHDSGFETVALRISGRAGTLENAAQLARDLEALPQDKKRFIVFAYSKGLPDVMELLVRHPSSRTRIAAVVSYAGAFNGSLLADEFRGLYDEFISKLPLDGCAAGTGDELEALRPSVRQAWWQAHQAEIRASRIPFFSLVGAPLPDRVSPVLRFNHTSLAKRDANNDGQLLAADAVVPGSALLGFVNADHWSMAIPLSKELPSLAALFRDDLPRGALVSAAIAVVDQTITINSTSTTTIRRP